MGKALCPIGCHDAFAGQEIDVGGGVHRDHVGVQTVVHCTRLRARTAMRLIDLDVFASGLFVIGNEGCVVVFVKLAGHVIRGVEQSLGRNVQA